MAEAMRANVAALLKGIDRYCNKDDLLKCNLDVDSVERKESYPVSRV